MKVKASAAIAAMLLAVCAAVAANAAETKYKTYTDKKFGYSIEYPDIYNCIHAPFTDADGSRAFGCYSSEDDGDGRYAFEVLGGEKAKGVDGNVLLHEATTIEEDDYGHVYGVEPLPGTAKSDAGFYTFEYNDNSSGSESISHVYCVIGNGVMAKYWIRFPKGEAERFAEITKRMDASLTVK